MKVLFNMGSLNRGGTETLMFDLLSNAELFDFKPILVYRKNGELLEEFKKLKVPVTKLSNNGFVYLFQLYKLVVQNKVKIIHSQQPLDCFYSILIALLLKVKVIQTIHGFDYSEKNVSKILNRFSLKFTNRNVFVSEFQKQYFIKQYKLNNDKQLKIYNGINFSKFENSNSIKYQFLSDSNTILLGMVGNFVHGRDQFTVCRFLKLLNNEGIDFKFLFIGKKSSSFPEIYDECYRFCEKNNLLNRVLFLGSRSDVPDLLKSLDAFIYSTDHDTFGIAVVEAMLNEVPVFVNDWDVMKELTNNGDIATIYKSRNETDLFARFQSFINNKNEFYLIASKSKEFCVKNYSIKSQIINLNLLYKSITC